MATDQEVPAMRANSMDLREQVVAAVDEGEGSQRQIARLFRVSLWFVSRLLQWRRQKGTLAPEPHRGGSHRVLEAVDRWRLAELVKQHNDDTLEEPRRRGGFHCSLTTIWRALRRRGLTRKKKSQHADERERSDVKQKQRSFRRKVRQVEPGRLQFVDESGVNTAMTRAYG
jgi:transposase